MNYYEVGDASVFLEPWQHATAILIPTSALPMSSHYSIVRAAQLPDLAAPPTELYFLPGPGLSHALFLPILAPPQFIPAVTESVAKFYTRGCHNFLNGVRNIGSPPTIIIIIHNRDNHFLAKPLRKVLSGIVLGEPIRGPFLRRIARKARERD